VDEPENLARLLNILTNVDLPLLFPVHPLTGAVMDSHGPFESCNLEESKLQLIDPLGNYEFMNLVIHSGSWGRQYGT